MSTSYAFSRKPASSYRAWKKNETGEDVKIDSVRDFPSLVQAQKKQSVFEGVSLASKLKDVLAAEEEAAVQKRLKKGDTAEQILRESCVVLPLRSSSKKKTSESLVIPDWVLDHSTPLVLPSFRPKSFPQVQQERYWARLGVDSTQTKLYDTQDDDNLSVVSMPTHENHEEEDQPSLSEEE